MINFTFTEKISDTKHFLVASVFIVIVVLFYFLNCDSAVDLTFLY